MNYVFVSFNFLSLSNILERIELVRFFTFSRFDFLQLSSYDNGTKIDFDLITGKSHEKSKILTMSSDVLVTFTSANIANSARNNTAQRFKFTYTESKCLDLFQSSKSVLCILSQLWTSI